MALKPWLVHRGKFGRPSDINLIGELAVFKACCVMDGHQGWGRVWITRYQCNVDIVHCKVSSGSRCTLIRKSCLASGKNMEHINLGKRDKLLGKRRVGGKYRER